MYERDGRAPALAELWPQLEAVLRRYFAERERRGALGCLLFPSPVLSSESLITDFRKALDAAAGRCAWEKGEIRSKMFRHTYCSQRLQTFSWVKTGDDENGKPILSRYLANLSYKFLSASSPRAMSALKQ